MLGGKVKLQGVLERMSTFSEEVFLKSTIRVGIQVVLNDLNLGRGGVMSGDKPVHTVSVIGFGALLTYL